MWKSYTQWSLCIIFIANDPYVNIYTQWSLCKASVPYDLYVKDLYLMIPM